MIYRSLVSSFLKFPLSTSEDKTLYKLLCYVARYSLIEKSENDNYKADLFIPIQVSIIRRLIFIYF